MKIVRFTSSPLRSFRLLAALMTLVLWGGAARADFFSTADLVTDDQAANPAQITDGKLKNAWGVASSLTSPFWVSSNGAGIAVFYSINPTTNATTKQALEVVIPGVGSVTGQAFNGSSGFDADRFLSFSRSDVGTHRTRRSGVLCVGFNTRRLRCGAAMVGRSHAGPGKQGQISQRTKPPKDGDS